MSAPDIFLSYNRDDQAIAQRFAEAFKSQGFSVWWDVTLRSGEAYDQVTEEALRSAKAVVVLWSKKSVVSRWVRAEATIADRNGTLVPVRIEPCDLPVMFELTQTADLSHWHGSADDKSWQAFFSDVGRLMKKDKSISVGSPSPRDVTASVGGVPFVAVLPIMNRAGDDELTPLVEDLTEEITGELAQNSLFKVIAAGTMAAWRDRTIDHRLLGRELALRYLVEGKLQRAGEDIRLTLRLIDTASGGILQSLRFSRKLTELETSPELFTVSVACEVGEKIIQIESRRAMEKQGVLSGWDHVMRAMACMEHFLPDSTRMALEESRKAVEVAPDLGLAHAILARLIGPAAIMAQFENRAYQTRSVMDDDSRSEIHEHAMLATQLDGNNPVVLHYLVGAYANIHDGDACLRLARRAVELAPNSPLALFALGQAFVVLGRTTDAIAAFEEQLHLASYDLNRPHALMHLGICHCVEGRPETAEEILDQALALHPESGFALGWKAVAAAQQGREQAAKSAILRLREAVPGASFDTAFQMFSLIFPQRSVEARTMLHRLWDETGGDG